MKTYEKDIPAFPGQAVDRDEDNYANTGALCGKHTISGFHGSSGAPIARLKECDNGMVGSPAIIGLCKFVGQDDMRTDSNLGNSSRIGGQFRFQYVYGVHARDTPMDE